MNIIQKEFEFNNLDVEVFYVNNNVYFVGNQVAEILGYKNCHGAVSKHVEAEDKMTLDDLFKCSPPVLGGEGYRPYTTMISEPGLYSLVLRSKLPAAKEFKKWICSVVLPTIRKTGEFKQTSVITERRDLIEDTARAIDVLERLGGLDDKFRSILADQVKSVMLIQNSEVDVNSKMSGVMERVRHLFGNSLDSQIRYQNKDSLAGRRVAKAYRNKYGENTGLKQQKLVNGVYIPVNAYSISDFEDFLDDALIEFLKEYEFIN